MMERLCKHIVFYFFVFNIIYINASTSTAVTPTLGLNDHDVTDGSEHPLLEVPPRITQNNHHTEQPYADNNRHNSHSNAVDYPPSTDYDGSLDDHHDSFDVEDQEGSSEESYSPEEVHESETLSPTGNNSSGLFSFTRRRNRNGNGGKSSRRLEREQNKMERKQHRRMARDQSRRRDREARRHQRALLRRQNNSSLTTGPQDESIINELAWLKANVSALWLTIRQLQQHQQTDRGDVLSHIATAVGSINPHPTLSSSSSNNNTLCETSEWPTDVCETRSAMCQQDEASPVCSGNGECCCGDCLCNQSFYGAHCECGGEYECERYYGHECGGHGMCMCGKCQCDPGYAGQACECSEDTHNCRDPTSGLLCSDQGACVCGRCVCENEYAGKYCSQSPFKAGVCEELKPCVLCKALNKPLPQCRVCGHVTVNHVDELYSSHLMCRMVHSGCLLQYSYIVEEDGRYSVMVPRDMVPSDTKC